MQSDFLVVAARYIHIVSAIFAVGGMAFMIICVSPAMRLVDDSFRESILRMVSKRFTIVQNVAVIALLLTGVYNWVLNNETYSAIKPWGQMLIGTKTLLALVLFGIVWARTFGLIKEGNPKRWLMINIHIAAVVILLASILRHLRLEHLAG